MFNNLIESSSHAREFKRRGSFVLFTTGIYAVLFIVAGVASIYAYDARLDDQNFEYAVTMLSPLDFQPAPAPERNVAPQRSASGQQIAIRQIAMARVDQTQVVPDKTSAVANVHLPVPRGIPFEIGDHDSNPLVAGGSPHGNLTGPGNGTSGPIVDVGAPPPAAPAPTPQPKRIIKESRVLNGLAISLPKPPYPMIAKQARAQGSVNVQVVIDESGRVISAKSVSGHPLLMQAAQQAAYGARFSPTSLNDQPVKVSGVITYNFVLQ